MTPMKPIFKSKTAAVAVVTAIAGFWGPSREWIAQNPTGAMSILAVISVILRIVTRDQVTLF